MDFVNIKTEVGILIRTKRKELKLRQKTVADQLGFTNAFLAKIENGSSKLPVKYIDQISTLLKIERPIIYEALEKDFASQLKRKML